MGVNPLFDIDTNDILGLTRALVDIESVSKNEENLCNLIQEWVEKIRPDAKVTRARNNLVVQIGDQINDKPIILAGHIDTVPPATTNGVSNQASRIEGDFLVGLGASDMKSGVATMISIIADIQISSTFIFYECEEIAEEFSGLRYLATEHSDLLDGKWAILLEPTNGQLEMGCQGSLNVEATFTGVRAHSARPWMGENAIHKAAKTLENGVRESTNQPEVDLDGLIYTPALQVTAIEGGVAKNIIPDQCIININHRFSPDVSADAAQKYVFETICDGADKLDVKSIAAGAIPAMDHPIVEYATKNGRQLVPKIGWTDVARFYELGIPAVNCGPGDPLMCHRADENVEISKLIDGYEFLRDFIKTLD